MGLSPTVALIWQDPHFLVQVYGRKTDKGMEQGVGVLPFLKNSEWSEHRIIQHLQELTADLVRLADKAGYPSPRGDGMDKMFWQAAASSFVSKQAASRIKQSDEILTKSTKCTNMNSGYYGQTNPGVGLRLNTMAEFVYVLAGAINHGLYNSARSFEGSSVFQSLLGGK